MPTEQVKEEKKEPMVDLDTSGPGADVELPEEKVQDAVETVEPEQQVEEKVEEKQEASDKEQETKPEEKKENKEELEQYSEGVQKRIAKLTKKWREAERQKEAALEFAQGVQAEHSELKTRYSRLEPNYVTALENKVTAGLEAAKSKLEKAREAGDINAEVDAQKSIAQLGVEESRLTALRERQSQDKERVVKTPSLQEAVGQRTPAPDPRAEAWAE